jgi:transcriptional regulator with XRE-family HTH domain
MTASTTEFGRMITARLRELGWRQAELARRTGLSGAALSNIIRGKVARPLAANVDRIAAILGLESSAARLAAGLAPRPGGRSEAERELLKIFKGLRPDYDEDLLAIARTLYERHVSTDEVATDEGQTSGPAVRHAKRGRHDVYLEREPQDQEKRRRLGALFPEPAGTEAGQENHRKVG